MTAGREESGFRRDRNGNVLTLRPVDRKRFGRGQHFGSALLERADCCFYPLAIVRRSERKFRFEGQSRRQLQSPETHLHARERAESVEQTQHADLSDVAFEQRVGGLRRRVRDKRNFGRIDRAVRKEPRDAVDDSGRNAGRRGVGRRHFHARYDFAALRIYRDNVGKRAAHIDAEAQLTHRNA